MAKKILIIEDSPTDLAITEKLFSSDGFSVEVAQTGKEGIKKALETKPDLIMLDLILPDISGFEVCKQLKKEEGLKKTLIIALTIKDDTEDIKKAFHAGVDDYIIKPPEPAFLVTKIKLYLKVDER